MKILPIFKFTYSPLKKNNNRYSPEKSFTDERKSNFTTKTNPSFGIIDCGTRLRNAAARRLYHCIYCKRPMQNDANLSMLKRTGVFSGTIQNYVQKVFQFLGYMHKSEKEVFKRITMMAFEFPNIRLSEAIKKLYPEANIEILKEQVPIIQEISQFEKEIPRGHKTKFKKLMKVTKFRLEGKEYIPEEFSGKEFAYKLGRIEDTIKDEYIAQRIKKLTEPLTHPIFKKPKEQLTEKFKDKILTLTETRDVDSTTITKADLQLLIINQIRKYAEILNRKDIINNCVIAERTIKGLPVKIKFSNKAFRYDLCEILDDIGDAKLKEKILLKAQELPNSQTSANGFITKHERAASDAIGYNILRPSRATVEHMEAKSTKTPSSKKLSNFVLACERCNNTRSNKDMKIFIEQYNPNNHTQYFKDLWNEVEAKQLDKDTFWEMVNNFSKMSGRKIKL